MQRGASSQQQQQILSDFLDQDQPERQRREGRRLQLAYHAQQQATIIVNLCEPDQTASMDHTLKPFYLPFEEFERYGWEADGKLMGS